MKSELRVSVARVPMRVAFGHARASRNVAESVLVAFESNGSIGFGEAVPREYVTGETIDSAYATLSSTDWRELEQAREAKTFEEAVASVEALRLHERRGADGTAQHAPGAALEGALLDWIGRRFARPFADVVAIARAQHRLPARSRSGPIPVSRVWDLSTPLEAFIARGKAFHHVKVKAEGTIADTAARIERLREHLPPNVPISIDANMAWSLEESISAARVLSAAGLAWLEEPMTPRRFDDYRRLREATGVRVMLDESVRTLAEAEEAFDRGACDSINVRVSKVGGVFAAVAMIALVERRGGAYQLGVQVGELGPLRAEVLHVASGSSGWLACEVGQAEVWFADALTDPPPHVDPESFTAEVPAGPGLGIRFTDALAGSIVRSASIPTG